MGSANVVHRIVRSQDQVIDRLRDPQALAAAYGLGRRVYEGLGSRLGVQTLYLEIAAGDDA
jgi:hypothetical protein